MKSLELFSGTGGLAKGLELAGFKHMAFVEKDKFASLSLRENFDPSIVFSGDVKDFDFSTLSGIDIVAGGPPCQPFSLGGKHKADEDHRDMFPYAIDAIEKLQPKAFIFENVKGLLRSSFSDYFEYIILRLSYPDFQGGNDWREHLIKLRQLKHDKYSGIHYNVSFKLINAANYGVPQVRERVFIVGIRSDIDKVWSFPESTHSLDRLLWDKFVTHSYWERHNLPIIKNDIIFKKLTKKYGFFEPVELPWQTVRDALINVPDPLKKNDIEDHTFRGGARVYPGHTGSYIDLPSKTLKAGGHGVPGGENMIRYEDESVRYFTIYEGKLIQTFPSDFKIIGAWGEAMRQIGNAVPVLLAKKIGQNLINLLNK
ncbi:Cytosine-specific methyltransferase [Yersinia intermedia]|uniref:DNA cytosine methyltransferase n=1 Tax=Yersinia intermedia TaxID=631 RepID=UPI0005E7F5E2|nr:DNA cytosine methyltransferase [Yersinia intermedia]MDA5514174.1 DNA cytosine methyltransferase [Yersinia intermedia]CQD81086.1 Cytosine-specific methyltransferase [Yersinia intermedia]